MNTLSYCDIRRGLEDRCSILVSKLATATSRLVDLAGKQDLMFWPTRNECSEIHDRIATCRNELQDHRDDHGC